MRSIRLARACLVVAGLALILAACRPAALNRRLAAGNTASPPPVPSTTPVLPAPSLTPTAVPVVLPVSSLTPTTVPVPSLAPTVPAPAVPSDPVYWPTGGWRTSPPEEQGMDPDRLAGILEAIEAEELEVHSLLVVRHGYIVLETYYPPYTQDSKDELYSVTKSVVSALLGIAIEQGYIESLDAPVLSFFPDMELSDRDPRKEAMTLEHLVSMSSGLRWQDDLTVFMQMDRSPDGIQFVLDRPMAAEPGTVWHYNSGGIHVLAAVLQQATGRDLLDFAQEFLFTPLGISDVTWNIDRQGIRTGGWGLEMTPRDMAKIGLLYLNDGRWEGRQVVPADWVRQSTEERFEIRDAQEEWDVSYGYGWWLHGFGAYAAQGLGSQLIVVVPDQDTVIVMTAWLDGMDVVRAKELLREWILDAILSSAPAGSLLE